MVDAGRHLRARRAIALALVLSLPGCSHSVPVPLDAGTARRIYHGKHRIETVDEGVYVARAFEVGDSTLVIQELDSSDERYAEASLPIPLRRDEIGSITAIKTSPSSVDVVVVIGMFGVAFGFMMWLFSNATSFSEG